MNQYGNINDLLDNIVFGDPLVSNEEVKYLSTQAPNIIQWIAGIQYWNVPTIYEYYRQYQILRDLFNIRCKICNPQDYDSIEVWGKPRSYLESEVLLEWNASQEDFVCPKCGNSLQGFIEDRIIIPYTELICISGMRSGKSYLGAMICGYIEHMLRARSMLGRGAVQRLFKLEKSEWLEVTFAASTATQAKETIYAKYREMRNNSPWIDKHVKYVQKLEATQVGKVDKWEYKALDDTIEDGYLQVRFNRVSSNSAGIAGKTRIIAAIDELGRLANTDSKTSAQELYRVLNQSLKTVRGAINHNPIPPYYGLMLNVTSPMEINGLDMQLYNMAKSGVAKKTYFSKSSTWEFNPKLKRSDFEEEYAKDPVGAERDYGANPPAAETPLIDNPARFWKSVDFSRKPTARFVNTYISDPTGKKYIGAKLEHVDLDFEGQYHIFADAGLTFDAFAFVIAHAVVLPATGEESQQFVASSLYNENQYGGSYENERPSYVKGVDNPQVKLLKDAMRRKEYDTFSRISTVIDACYRIVPTREREIWFNSLIDIIKDLQKRIKITGVYMDAWGSASLIQDIRDLNIQAYKVKLRTEDFFSFVSHCYGGTISLLPPDKNDLFSLDDNGIISVGTPEEIMCPDTVGLYELLRLSRTPDLKGIVAPEKGSVRGRGSDDIARCIIGVDRMIKNSVIDSTSQTGRKREILKRQIATSGGSSGGIIMSSGVKK
jgi:hypothetical protein